MNEQNELSGTVVLVKPNLINDPANKKNQVGIIVMASVEHDNITVSFVFDGDACFSANALLVLRNPAEIYRDVLNDVGLLPFEDFENIMAIHACANSQQIPYHRLAVELSMKNPNALEYTMDTLENVLTQKRDYGVGR